jgi:hypothetical protein
VNPRRRLANALKAAEPEDLAADGNKAGSIDHGQLWTSLRAGIQCEGREVSWTDCVACQFALQHSARMRLASADLHASMVGELNAGPHGNCTSIQYSAATLNCPGTLRIRPRRGFGTHCRHTGCVVRGLAARSKIFAQTVEPLGPQGMLAKRRASAYAPGRVQPTGSRSSARRGNDGRLWCN